MIKQHWIIIHGYYNISQTNKRKRIRGRQKGHACMYVIVVLYTRIRDTDRNGRIDGKNLLLDMVCGMRRVSVPEDDGADDATDVFVGPHAQQDPLRTPATFRPQICNAIQ